MKIRRTKKEPCREGQGSLSAGFQLILKYDNQFRWIVGRWEQVTARCSERSDGYGVQHLVEVRDSGDDRGNLALGFLDELGLGLDDLDHFLDERGSLNVGDLVEVDVAHGLDGINVGSHVHRDGLVADLESWLRPGLAVHGERDDRTYPKNLGGDGGAGHLHGGQLDRLFLDLGSFLDLDLPTLQELHDLGLDLGKLLDGERSQNVHVESDFVGIHWIPPWKRFGKLLRFPVRIFMIALSNNFVK